VLGTRHPDASQRVPQRDPRPERVPSAADGCSLFGPAAPEPGDVVPDLLQFLWVVAAGGDRCAKDSGIQPAVLGDIGPDLDNARTTELRMTTEFVDR